MLIYLDLRGLPDPLKQGPLLPPACPHFPRRGRLSDTVITVAEISRMITATIYFPRRGNCNGSTCCPEPFRRTPQHLVHLEVMPRVVDAGKLGIFVRAGSMPNPLGWSFCSPLESQSCTNIINIICIYHISYHISYIYN